MRIKTALLALFATMMLTLSLLPVWLHIYITARGPLENTGELIYISPVGWVASGIFLYTSVFIIGVLIYKHFKNKK